MDRLSRPEFWPVIAFSVSALLLIGAHVFEAMGYDPCLLCLRQREIHWAALAVAAAGLIAIWRWPDRRVISLTNVALAAVFLTSFMVAGYHAGVEYGFWPGPAACSAVGGGAVSGADILAALEGPSDAPSCSEAPWSLMGVSMAGFNALISLALLGLSVLTVFRIETVTRNAHA